MKAKVKETGKVIDVKLNMNSKPVVGTGASHVFEGSDGKTYFDTELDLKNVYPDWQNVRIQAAIAVIQGAWARTISLTYEELAQYAVKQADALINELKK